MKEFGSIPEPAFVSPQAATSPEAVALCLSEARAALKTAREDRDALEKLVRTLKQNAEDEINERYRAQRQAAVALINAATKVFQEAQDLQEAHPWTGRRVFARKVLGSAWSQKYERVEGVVETRRSTTVFPVNTADYRLPSIGEGFVRLVKKDGALGTKFDRLNSDWRLIDPDLKATEAGE